MDEFAPRAAQASQTVIERMLTLARSHPPDDLGEATIAALEEDLYAAAVTLFGGWDVALAHALHATLMSKQQTRRSAGSGVERRPPTPRQSHPDALRPVYVLTQSGYIIQVGGAAIAASDMPAAPVPLDAWPVALGAPTRLVDLGTLDALVAVSDDGRVFGWDARLVPDYGLGQTARRLGERQGVERWITVMDHAAFEQKPFFVHATRHGRMKVSQTTGFPCPLDASGVLSFALDPGDVAVGSWLAERSDHLLLLASNGYGIAFEINDARPVGLKNCGGRGMQLREGGQVVGGVLVNHALEVAFVTQQGYAKRVLSDEFRPQVRGGQGLLSVKLDADDALCAGVSCDPSTDLAITTSWGRVLRVPAPMLPVMPRNTRGERVLELAHGERVIAMDRLLPAAFSDTSPMAFEI